MRKECRIVVRKCKGKKKSSLKGPRGRLDVNIKMGF